MPTNTKGKGSIVVLIIVALVIFGVLGFGIYQNYSKPKSSTPDEVNTAQIETTQILTTAAPTTEEPTIEEPTTVPPTTVQPTTEEQDNSQDMYDAYLDTIRSNQVETYYVYDVNHDGIKELIIFVGTSSLNSSYDFYTYRDGQGAYNIGTIYSPRVLYESYGGNLETFWAKQGYYKISSIEISNGKIEENVLTENYTSDSYPDVSGTKLRYSYPDDLSLLEEEILN